MYCTIVSSCIFYFVNYHSIRTHVYFVSLFIIQSGLMYILFRYLSSYQDSCIFYFVIYHSIRTHVYFVSLFINLANPDLYYHKGIFVLFLAPLVICLCL